MQEWFFVQSAAYGYYYIEIEINSYDVYRISIARWNPETSMVNYPVEKTTTRDKAYARKRYKQFMQVAESDLYGWNNYADELIWELDESNMPSIAEYII